MIWSWYPRESLNRVSHIFNVLFLYMCTLQERVLIVRQVFEERLPTLTRYPGDNETSAATGQLQERLMTLARRMVNSPSIQHPIHHTLFTPCRTPHLCSYLLSADVPAVSSVLPGQFSTVGRPASCTPALRQKDPEEDTDVKKGGEVKEVGWSTARRIRAPRGEGISSLMASLTSSTPVNCCHDNGHSPTCGPSQVHSLPRLATNSSLNSVTGCNSVSYRTLSASSSCCQVSLGEVVYAMKTVTETKQKISFLYLFSSLLTGYAGVPQRLPPTAAL